ncbi:MAG: zinc-binding dehydrogenase [Nitrososphaera sp.]|nr:zinc-binding dehydrogenase [Nitrososphaera sp.]
MKAICITRPGGPEVLELLNTNKPELTHGQAVIRVLCVGLNWLDVLLRTEDFGLAFPHVPGSDVVGIVEQIESNDSIQPGDTVVVNPALPCASCKYACPSTSECRMVRILGVHSPGGFGEYIRVSVTQLSAKPAALSLEEAAAFPLDYLTAWRMLFTRGRMNPGETVFIWGASGSLGSAAVRLAKWAGARVIAAIGKDAYRQELTSLGADHVVNYQNEKVVDTVLSLTAGLGADLVFESIGASTFTQSVEMVRPHGRIVICGTRSGATCSIDLADVYYKQAEILGSRMGTGTEFNKLLIAMDTPALKPVVGKVLPIHEAREAHKAIENRNLVGKIVLKHDW